MALSGSVTTNSYDGRYYKVDWTAYQSIANNTSTISWNLSCAGAEGYWYAERTLYLVVAGNVVVNKANRIERFATKSIASGSMTIPHNSIGDASFNITLQVAIYGDPVNATGSQTFSLNRIPRASSMSWGSGTSFIAGVEDGVTIDVNRASSSFTHTITYKLGDASGTICEKSSDTSVKWTIPMDLLYQMPNSATGSGVITCVTYNGNSAIGTSAATFTITAPESVIPTITSTSLTLDNSSNSIIDGWDIAVSGFSKAKMTASAEGAYGSTISSFTIGGEYSTTQVGDTLDYTGWTFTSSGDKTFSVVAKDSRGRLSAEETIGTLYVYPYTDPRITSITAYRGSINPKQVTFKSDWTYADVGGNNTTTATLFYKKHSVTGWSTYGTVDKDTDIVLTAEFPEENSYDFKLIVTDSIGNSSESSVLISTSEVLLDFRAGGKGLGVGKIAESDAMEVALDVKLSKSMRVNDPQDTDNKVIDISGDSVKASRIFSGFQMSSEVSSLENKIEIAPEDSPDIVQGGSSVTAQSISIYEKDTSGNTTASATLKTDGLEIVDDSGTSEVKAGDIVKWNGYSDRLYNMDKVVCGSRTRVVGTNKTSVVVFTQDELNTMFGTTDSSNLNTVCFFANGDGDAQSAHVDGATWVNSSWYAVFNTSVTGSIRINYIAIKFH